MSLNRLSITALLAAIVLIPGAADTEASHRGRNNCCDNGGNYHQRNRGNVNYGYRNHGRQSRRLNRDWNQGVCGQYGHQQSGGFAMNAGCAPQSACCATGQSTGSPEGNSGYAVDPAGNQNIREGYTIDAAGNTVLRQGYMVDSAGNAVLRPGNMVDSTGNAVIRGGAQVSPIGNTRIQADGTVNRPDSTGVRPDSAVNPADGARIRAESVVNPQGNAVPNAGVEVAPIPNPDI